MRAPVFKIDPQKPEDNKIRVISKILLNGGLLIIPTETVYGIAADMRNKQAVSRLYEVKQRPKDKPFSLLIHNKEQVESFAKDPTQLAFKLIDEFWPGPLTLILQGRNSNTVGLRMPDNKIALRLIADVGAPLFCPSANLSGKTAPINLDEAMSDLADKVDGAIDGGVTKLGIESTIVDLTDKSYKIKRQGALAPEDIRRVANKKIVLFVCTGNSCRSVMAKAFLEKRLQEENRHDIGVLSAGILGIPSLGVTSETRKVLEKEGIIIEGHASRKVDGLMIKKADIILVMERMHEDRILKLVPQAKTRLFLLKEFAKIEDGPLDIVDPIGQSIQFYEHTFSIIKQAINRIIKIL